MIGRVLGVRNLLVGPVRKRPGSLRLAIELCGTKEGDSLWGDRIAAAAHDPFAVQEAIVAHVVAGIAPSIKAAGLRPALRRRPDSLPAYDLTLRAMHAMEGLRAENASAAGEQCRRAIAAVAEMTGSVRAGGR